MCPSPGNTTDATSTRLGSRTGSCFFSSNIRPNGVVHTSHTFRCNGFRNPHTGQGHPAGAAASRDATAARPSARPGPRCAPPPAAGGAAPRPRRAGPSATIPGIEPGRGRARTPGREAPGRSPGRPPRPSCSRRPPCLAVERLDVAGVLADDGPAADLERGRELVLLLEEVPGQDPPPLDLLGAGELGVHGLDRTLDGAGDLGMLG